MVFDQDRRLMFPPEITTTTYRPDVVIWSSKVNAVIIPELTTSGEDCVFQTNKMKHFRETFQFVLNCQAGSMESRRSKIGH